MPDLTFTTEPLSVIVPLVRDRLRAEGRVTFEVDDPDLGVGQYSGEPLAGPDQRAGLYRPLAVWADLADALGAHLLVPERRPGGRLRLCYRAYSRLPGPDSAGYDPAGEWGRVDKLEDPVFLLTLIEALERVGPPAGGRVLALGVNSGRELDALALAFPERSFQVVGMDLNAPALQQAARRFPEAQFLLGDINALPPDLGQADLILALSVLQSPGVRQDVLLATLRKHHLTPTGGMILGFPNARYLDGFLSYGARMRNFARPDFSLLMADVTNARRQLQKYGFKVFVTGKYEVLVTAIPAGVPTPRQPN